MQFVAQAQQQQASQHSQYSAHHDQQLRQTQTAAAKSRFGEVPNAVALEPGVERLDPTVVYELLKSGGCVLVDVRGDDRSSGTIEGAVNVKAIDDIPFINKVPDLVQKLR